MRYFLGVFALLILTVHPSYAQIDIASLCTKLTQHQPDEDVTYRAGVDVNGNAVVPADINAGFQPNTSFEIPVTIDLAERLNIDVDGLELEPSFGTLVYTGDNRVTYGGNDITDRALYLCNENGDTYSTSPEIVEKPSVVTEPTVKTDIHTSIPSVSVVDSVVIVPENNSSEIIEGDYGQDTINGIYND